METNTPSTRSTIIFFLVLVVLIVGGVIVLAAARPPASALTIIPPPPTQTSGPTNTPAPLTVYVTGAINGQAGMVTVPAGSRVSDAIAAAGGLRPDADQRRVNLAALVRDGDHIDVPTVGETPPPQATAGFFTIPINTATLDELDRLPGVGPSLAQAIIDYRDTYGRFSNLEDLDQVEGIGESTLQEIAEYIIFD